MENYDDLSRKEFKRNKNSVVGYLLTASYIYYHRPHMTPPLTRGCRYSHRLSMCGWILSNRGIYIAKLLDYAIIWMMLGGIYSFLK